MAAKQFQTRTEEEILTMKVLTLIWINIYDLRLILYANYWDL